MRYVGLTGGIGSGKSSVARLLAARGAIVIDSDVLAREVVEPGSPGLQAIQSAFGEGVLLSDGSLDRAALAAIVFSDPSRREKLNAIVHPLVARRAAELVANAAPDSVVVHDVPLLAETHASYPFDLVIVVDAEPEAQLDRLVRIRGMEESDAQARMAAQASRGKRLAIADIVIVNNATLEELDRQIDLLWPRIAGLSDQEH